MGQGVSDYLQACLAGGGQALASASGRPSCVPVINTVVAVMGLRQAPAW